MIVQEARPTSMIRAEEAARRLDVSVDTVYALVRRGAIGCYRIPSRKGARGAIRFEERHLDEFLVSVEKRPRPEDEEAPRRAGRRRSAASDVADMMKQLRDAARGR